MIFEKKSSKVDFTLINRGEPFFYQNGLHLGMAIEQIWWQDDNGENCGANAVDLVSGKVFWLDPDDEVERANVKIVEA